MTTTNDHSDAWRDHLTDVAYHRRRIRNIGFDIQDSFEDVKKRTLADLHILEKLDPTKNQEAIKKMMADLEEFNEIADAMIKVLDSWGYRAAQEF